MLFMHHFYITSGPIFQAFEDADVFVVTWLDGPDQKCLANAPADFMSLVEGIAYKLLEERGYDMELVEEISDLDPCTPRERSQITDLMTKLEATREMTRAP